MAERDLRIKLSLEDNATSKLAKVGADFKQIGENMASMGAKMSLGITTPLAALAGFAIKEAVSAEAAQTRLIQILRVTNDVTADQIKLLNDQANALQQVGVVSADNVTVVQSQLATFDLTVDTLHALTPAILDYVVAEKGATASAEDFKQMTNGLAQALQGNFASLTRTGFVLDEATKKLISNGTEAERTEALVKVLGSTYDGFNAAARNTAQGGMVALRNSFNSLLQQIGNMMIPTVVSLTNRLTDLLGWFQNLSQGTRNMMLVFGTFIATLGPAIFVIGKTVSAFLALQAALVAVRVATLAALGPWGLAIAAATTLAGIVGFNLFTGNKKATESTAELDRQMALLNDQMNNATGAADLLNDGVSSVGKSASEAANKIKDLNKQALAVFNQIAEDEAGSKKNLAEALISQEERVRDIRQQLRNEERKKDGQRNEDRIEELQMLLARERQALESAKFIRIEFAEEVKEAERRASLTAFERQVEDILRQRVERLKAHLVRLQEIQEEIKVEEEKNKAIARSFAVAQQSMRDESAVTFGVVSKHADDMKRKMSSVFEGLNFGATANSTAAFGRNVRSVNDAIISPKGDIITTHPDDYLIATKTPGSLGGGGVTVNITGGTFYGLDDMAEQVGDAIIRRLSLSSKLVG
jgi:hypothetical protein